MNCRVYACPHPARFYMQIIAPHLFPHTTIMCRRHTLKYLLRSDAAKAVWPASDAPPRNAVTR
jgi:hypothetical protein